jgi:hypothetical protein
VVAGVRAQYHFRNSPEGLRAWDVRKLVGLARGLSAQRVPLSQIRELDETYWSGDPPRPMTCREVAEHARLMMECSLSFPVILSSDGRVMDGMHRICKALFEGRDDILAVRFVEDPPPDYVGVAEDDLPYVDD